MQFLILIFGCLLNVAEVLFQALVLFSQLTTELFKFVLDADSLCQFGTLSIFLLLQQICALFGSRMLSFCISRFALRTSLSVTHVRHWVLCPAFLAGRTDFRIFFRLSSFVLLQLCDPRLQLSCSLIWIIGSLFRLCLFRPRNRTRRGRWSDPSQGRLRGHR